MSMHNQDPGDLTERDPLRRRPEDVRVERIEVVSETRVTESDVVEDAEDPEEIRAEIAQTRSELSETIDAIQERLSPQTLVAEAKDAVREATVGRAEQMVSNVGQTVGNAANEVVSTAEDVVSTAGDTARGATSTIMDTIRENPLPAALAGIGLGWLFMNSRSRSSAPRSGYYRREYQVPAYMPTAGRTYGYSAQPGRGTSSGGGVGRAVGKAQETAGEVVEQARETAEQVASATGEMVSAAGERVGDLASSAGSTATGAGSSLLDTIKRNPVPAALTGLGIAWLLSSRESGSGRRESAYGSYGGYAGSRYQAAGYGGYRPSDQGGTGVTDFARQATGQAAERIEEIGGRVQHQAEQIGGKVQHQAERAQGELDRTLYENPLAVGAVALGIGAAVGFAVPGTRQENQLMGEARDTLVERVQETAHEVQDKVQRVAQEAQRAAREEAENQNLTG